MRARALMMLCIATAASGCVVDSSEEMIGQEAWEVGVSGRWQPSAEVLAIGDGMNVPYTGAGAWRGEAGCSGTFSAGGEILRQYILEHFPQTPDIGGYVCRPIVGNSSKTSVHGTGRALDIMIPTVGGDADNSLGDPIAQWLIQNAEHIGIQFIIWDRASWMAERSSGDKLQPYSGGDPHLDHLHVELSMEAGSGRTRWFQETRRPPETELCKLPKEGGIIDDNSECTQLLGPSEYWRIVQGEGYEDRLAWTNAQAGSAPSNWARWLINLDESGVYSVEVYGGSEFSQHKQAEYEIAHDGRTERKVIDQRNMEGWTSIGRFGFDRGSGQHVALFDTGGSGGGADEPIAVDAIRLRYVGPYTGRSHFQNSGCQTSGGSTWWSLLLVVCAWGLRRRRR